MRNGWNFADIWEWVADHLPDAPGQVQGDRRFTWAEMDRRADGIAAVLLAGGAGHQDKVAQYLHNAPEYLESMFGIYKAALVPVNTNYRYTDDELVHLWTNADAVAVIFHGSFADRVERVRHRVPAVATWVHVAGGSDVALPAWAIAVRGGGGLGLHPDRRPLGTQRRRPVHPLHRRHDGDAEGRDVAPGRRRRQPRLRRPAVRCPAEPSAAALAERLVGPGPVNLPGRAVDARHRRIQRHVEPGPRRLGGDACPGAASTSSNCSTPASASRSSRSRSSVTRSPSPMLRALDAEPDRWDISSLRVVVSSGVMWSAETKAGLLRHNPRLILLDSLGSSEAIGMANATTTAGGTSATARFRLGPQTRVLTADGRDVAPGSGERGRVAQAGRMPVGYYKDAEKSAATFAVIDGVRYSIPGDWAEVEADGTVKLLGRGSQCINTGGEKVYPEEVEEVLKEHPAVADAAVVGLPDERFGEAVTALVEPLPGCRLDPDEVIAHVKAHLAAFKAPKRVIEVASIGRAANGKLDYRRLKVVAEAHGSAPPEPGHPEPGALV